MTSAPAWIANRPRRWRAVPFRYLYRRTKRVGYENETLLSVYRDHGVVDKSSRSDNFNNASEDLGLYQLVDIGDLAINKMKAWQGSVAVSPIRGIVSPAYFVYTPTHHEHSGFLHYLLRSAEYVRLYQLYSKGIRVNQWDLDPSVHGSMPVLLPPVEEQRRIAEFLDRETAQIDELIAKQEQLISTLAERLDSRWSELFVGLGREHGLTPVRRLIRSIVDGPFGSSLTSAHYVDEGHRVIRLGNLGIWAFKDNDKAFIDTEYAETLAAHAVRSGDVLVAGLGDEKVPLGRACVAPDGLGPAIVKADCYRVRPSHGVAPEYLAWALSAPPTRDQFQLLSRGTTRSRLNTTVVREARVPFPSVWEQERVTHEFKIMIADHERLAACAEGVKSLLAERRQALISAAVTGQIDVGGAS